MFNRYTYLLAYLCIPMLFLFGCSTSFNKKVNKKPDIRLLEKRIDDLSGKISLIIYDTNVLHNEMDEIKTANKTIQEKIEGLEVTVSVLNEQVSSLHTPARAPDIAQPSAEETDIKQQIPISDSSKTSAKPESDVQKTENTEAQMQTITVKEDGQRETDAVQAMTSMPGASMGEMTQSTGKVIEEGIEQGAEEMRKPAAEDMPKDLQEMTQTREVTPDIKPQTQETAATSVTNVASEQAKREAFLKDNIVRLAEAEFPDNKGIQWNILSFEHKGHLTNVEVEPTPATAGYPRFKFAVSFKNPETPRVIGTYCFKDGQYSLLSTRKN